MAAGQGSKIEWTDYNEIQSLIAPILGATPTSSGTSGYGQTVTSGQVTQYGRITNGQWANLRADILRARQHQTSTNLASTLTVPYFEITVTQTSAGNSSITTGPSDSTANLSVNLPVAFYGSMLGGLTQGTTYFINSITSSSTFTISTTQGGSTLALTTGIGSMTMRFGGTKITEADRAAYKAAAQDAVTNKLIAMPASEGGRDTLYNDNYLLAWNGVLTNIATVQFASYDAARYFFNSRGQIEISSTRAYGTGGLKNATWTTMLDPNSGMGTIIFNYNSTSNIYMLTGNTASGSPSSNIGFYQLTTSNQLIFEKQAPSGDYSANKYRIYAKLSDGNGGVGSNSRIDFQIEWRDESGNPNPQTYGTFGPFGVDENVDGTMNSTVQMFRSTGSVFITAPTAGIANNFYTTALPSTNTSYTITPSATAINEGQSITYTITSTGVANGTVIYWTNAGSTVAADFTDSINSGSITINSNSGSLTRTLSNDLVTEGPQTVQIQLRTGSTSGPIVASSNSVNVTDTSLTPITYAIAPDITGRQDEGTTITYTVTLTNFGSGTLFWANTGTTTAADFTDGTNTGSVPIANNSGSFTRTVKNDNLTEGDETVIMELRVGSTSGTTVATATTITANDSSTTIAPSYTISTNLFTNVSGREQLSEGSTMNVYVDTNSQVSSNAIYWKVTGGVTAGDLSVSALQGSLAITPGSRSTLSFLAANDGTTEGTETFYLDFYSNSGYTTALANATGGSRTIDLLDTSLNLAVGPTSITTPTSGSNYSVQFTAANGSGIYSYSCTSGTLLPGTTLNSNGALSGVVTYASSYSFTITAKDSNNVTGSRTYAGTTTANELVTAPSSVGRFAQWFYRVDYGIPNGTFTINNGATLTLDGNGTFSAYANFAGATGTYTYTFRFAGSGTTRVVTVTST